MTTTRVDRETGVEESLVHLPTSNGPIYAWTARPPGSRRAVVICSSIFADFTNNYHREQRLGRELASSGFGVVRFHYTGEGNSGGERSDMTFDSLCDNAKAVLEYAQTVGFSTLAVVGTRLGAAVAAKSIVSSPKAPLVMWEPVREPLGLINEGHEWADLHRRINTATTGEAESWEDELSRLGVLDLIGYDVYSPLVDSLGSVDLLAILGHESRPVFIGDFRSSTDAVSQLATTLTQRAFDVTRETYELNEAWWLKRDNIPETGALISDTVAWLGERLDHD